MTGIKHNAARRRANSAGQKRRSNVGTRFDIAKYMRGKASPLAKPIGSTRISNGHTQIKCADGKYRYRARAVWIEAHGPITSRDIIHHCNGNPHDDRLSNLQLVTRSEHATIHDSLRAISSN